MTNNERENDTSPDSLDDHKRTLELFLHDLKPEARCRVLRFFDVRDAKEMNLDVMPFSVLEREAS